MYNPQEFRLYATFFTHRLIVQFFSLLLSHVSLLGLDCPARVFSLGVSTRVEEEPRSGGTLPRDPTRKRK